LQTGVLKTTAATVTRTLLCKRVVHHDKFSSRPYQRQVTRLWILLKT